MISLKSFILVIFEITLLSLNPANAFVEVKDMRIKKKTISSASSVSSSKDDHVHLLDQSLRRHTSFGVLEHIQKMISSSSSKSSSLPLDFSLQDIHHTLRFALCSHGKDEGTLDGAIHNYANFGALSVFQMTNDVFLEIPARKLASAGSHQFELEYTLTSLFYKEDGHECLSNYSGFRCTKNGDVFYIRNALVSFFICI